MRSHVSPVSVLAILLGDPLVMQDDKRDVCGQEEKPGEHDENHEVPRSILVCQNDLAEKNAMLQKSHHDEPIWNHEVLEFVDTAHIRQKEHNDGDDAAWEGNKFDVQV